MLCYRNFQVFHTNYKKTITKWASIGCMRMKSSAEPKTKTYSHTILFPKTDFPARSNTTRDEEIQKTAKFAELYNWQREHLKGPEYVLHDGPPYANGDLHMGHAVNKIIKDINNRYYVLKGTKVHYVPGWDCHGLPIELKALQQTKKASKKPSTPVEIRKVARTFALETIERQKEQFKSWGVMADWEGQCYRTLDTDYVKNQLELFYEMYEKGLIFRALKPVYWSPSSKTALAEAELEYDPQFKSTEVYVSFPLDVIPESIKATLNGETLSAIIWTTTPWTLMANRAICYHPELQYSVVKIDGRPGRYLVASALVEELGKTLERGMEKTAEFPGAQLSGGRYVHRALGASHPLVAAAHVSAARGAGLVHAAPAHGPEDFLVALQHHLPVECNVDESGRYCNLGSLDGLYVLGEGQEAVISLMGDQILKRGVYSHSYPLDWRTKQPVILRASRQWFIHTEALKEKALEALESVEILPAWTGQQSRQGFMARVQSRAYWCVSRQRAWGVPLPCLYRGDTPLVHRRIIEQLCRLLEERGPDAWWSCDVEDLLPADLAQELGVKVEEVTKGQDIMDIWLDSGCSWRVLGPGAPGPPTPRAALYSEGVDQLTGWFQSSLLTAVAATGQAPYERIFVHGFVVDSQKRKMSKSLGNVVAPDRSARVDSLRWWVASHGTQHTQIVLSEQLLRDCQAEVARIRALAKFLLGVIDLPPPLYHQTPQLNYFDKYMVAETYKFLRDVDENMKELKYNSVVKSILYFISNKVSALYCHCVKDRLYCAPKDSEQRISAQLVVNTILVSLCRAIGPILPHLIEEIWQHHPLYKDPFFFTRDIPVLPDESVDTSVMDLVLNLKKDIIAVTKSEDLRKFVVDVTVDSSQFGVLNELNSVEGVDESVLCEILEVSRVCVRAGKGGRGVRVEGSERGRCLRCRKYTAQDGSDKCLRCERAMNSLQ